MEITLNGKSYSCSEGVTVGDLLATLKLDPERVVVEHNRALLDRSEAKAQPIAEGDELEIVTLVGGG